MGVKEAIGGVPQGGPPPGRAGRREFGSRRSKLFWLAAILSLGLAAGLGGVLGAKADTVNNQDFCLQGDVTNPSTNATITCTTAQKDWTDFFDASGTAKTLPAGSTGVFTDSTFAADAALPDTTTYATGSKDTLPISASSGWQCSSSNNVGAKVDLQNTYATIERLNSDGHVILYYGAEIASANGNHNQGMWLLQDSTVGCDGSNGTTTFSGNHTNGDLLFAVQLTGGGSKPFSASTVAFEWQCTNDPLTKHCPTSGSTAGSLVALNGGNAIGSICGSTAQDEACAITNETWNVQTPWPPADSSATAYGPQQFFEGGIDITEVFHGTAPCFSRFLTDTRSSQSPTATLFDYTAGNLNTCAAPTVSTQLKLQAGSSQASTDVNVTSAGVDLGSKVYDTSTLTGALGTPGGTVTYKLFANNDCTGAVPSSSINGTSLGSDGTINDIVSGPTAVTSSTMPNSSTLTFTATGTYYWVAYYSGDGINLKGNSGCAAEPLKINPVTPTLTTTAAATTNATPPVSVATNSLVVGTTYLVSDSVTFSNTVSGVFPASTSTVTFTLYSDNSCTTAVTGVTATVNPSGSSNTVSSGSKSFTPTSTGTYTWGVSFSGDSNYNKVPASGVQCGGTNETLTVVAATPTLATQIHLDDKVTISGIVTGGTPTATVTFKLYDNADCTGNLVAEFDSVAISSGVASTLGLSPNSGSTWVNSGNTYSWKVTYSGDSNNSTVTAGCTTASHETAGISYAP